ncbi:polyprenyl synthetase family protein [Streptomyces chartreusis]|uniref:polyprenyl synthetase family protein n=1 Tax=Streptomyces chartreusis TaxID=1969 RepID=UPI002E19CD5F|nr:polyprenyl synthetase family protein [Streptomyces chartreusis]
MDRETLRRGRPALWQAYGHDRALVAGDALIGLAFASLSEHRHRRVRDALQVMGSFWNRTCAGQIHDVESQGHSELPLDEAVAVHVAKSAEGIGGVLRLSALLTDADDAQIEAVGRFGFEFGMALQYCNDLWDLWPTIHQGRLRFGDIRQRKMTPMVVACLGSGNADSEQLAAYYRGQGEPDEKHLARVAELIDRCGGRAWARERNHEHMRQALQHLQDAGPPPALYDDLATISSHYLA